MKVVTPSLTPAAQALTNHIRSLKYQVEVIQGLHSYTWLIYWPPTWFYSAQLVASLHFNKDLDGIIYNYGTQYTRTVTTILGPKIEEFIKRSVPGFELKMFMDPSTP